MSIDRLLLELSEDLCFRPYLQSVIQLDSFSHLYAILVAGHTFVASESNPIPHRHVSHLCEKMFRPLVGDYFSPVIDLALFNVSMNSSFAYFNYREESMHLDYQLQSAHLLLYFSISWRC